MNRYRLLFALIAVAVLAPLSTSAFAAPIETATPPTQLEAPASPLFAVAGTTGCAESLAVPTAPTWLPQATGCSNSFCNRCVANGGICTFDTGLNRCVCL